MGTDLYADYGGMQSVAGQVRAVARGVAHSERPIRAGADAAEGGAGEFAAQLSPGANAFATSWLAVLEIYSECGDLIAANIDTSVTVLTDTDGNLTAAQPAGPPPAATPPRAR